MLNIDEFPFHIHRPMQKTFIRSLILIVFLNLLIKPFWLLGIDRQVYNTLGSEEYGLFFTIFNFSLLFSIFLDLGITQFNNRNIARNRHLLSKHFTRIVTLKLLLGILYGSIIFLAGWIIGYREKSLYLLAWIGFNQFLLSFILYLRSNLSGLLLLKTDSLLSVLDRLLMILFCGLLLWANLFKGRFTIEWFVYTQTAAYIVTVLIALTTVCHRKCPLGLHWDFSFFMKIIKSSLPFASLFLLMSFHSRLNPVLIERLLPDSLGLEQSGVYSQAFRLLDAGQNFAYLFAVLLLPLFARMIALKEDVRKLLKLSFLLIISTSLIVAVGTLFFGKEIMMLLYGPFPHEECAHYLARIDQSSAIFNLLMFSFVAICSNYIFGTLLTANNSLRQLNAIALIGFITSLALNLVLIPEFQAIGSAWANLLSQALIAMLQLMLAFKIFKFRLNRSFLFRILGLVTTLLLSGYLAKRYMNGSWEWQIGSVLVVGLSSCIFLGLFKLRETLRMFRGIL